MNEQQIHSLEDILIVDDTPANLRLLSQMLIDEGYKVRAVTSGPRALKSAQTKPPDLILLDIMMPEMNGYQVAQRMKADERTFDIPIIFISAMKKTKDKVKAFAAGGVDYVTKPIQVDEVLARVETHLSLRTLQKHLERTGEVQAAKLTALAGELDQPLAAIALDVERLQALAPQIGERFRDDLERIGQSLGEQVEQCRQVIDRSAPSR